MAVPRSWDEERVVGCAFNTRAYYRGGPWTSCRCTFVIKTVRFDEYGNEIGVEGVCAEYDARCPFPAFAIVRPAIENTRVDMSPYGQFIFADAIDAAQAVDLGFGVMINEVDVSEMKVFLSDVLFDFDSTGYIKTATEVSSDNRQDLSEVGAAMSVAEFRQKCYGESVATAEERS